ncbi:succinyl-diaminopimelate desuccinylase [Nisaea nitritireducens]|uniref:succinyl-diaminopimelate desuccinylase n=1 Tax=Nisaea nitritireducens TaxID=568392 RepID=UPI001D00BDCC|nr:succinyl-diaminopimelate desuccinylase [Nisaea nitritireducens]
MIDPVRLTQDLVRCESVTPVEGGALALLEKELTAHGFTCRRMTFHEEGTPDVENLYARIGTGAPNICFAGHTDVVPPGDAADWVAPPFSGEIRDGRLYGRGSSDMKSGVACFAAAAASYVGKHGTDFAGSISFLITGDEEGPAINGTVKVLDWMAEEGESIDACIVGEPTNPEFLGQMMKIGRRGSFTGYLTVHGTQGHTAYPQLADNPIHRLVKMLEPLTEGVLDEGTEHFQPTTVAIATVDTGNPANNVIPAKTSATFNVRFNDLHTAESLEAKFRAMFDAVGGRYDLRIECTSNAFVTEPGPLSDAVAAAVKDVTGKEPELSTSGGTSDARFIRKFCPVVEFGIVGQTMHKTDEHVMVADIEALTAIYESALEKFFDAARA